jgi:acyl-CoA synthetase (AMP-forming)/AMP-acid ligase II
VDPGRLRRAHAAGAVLVPMNTRMKGAEAADILERSRHAGLLFVIGDFLGQYYPALLERPAARHAAARWWCWRGHATRLGPAGEIGWADLPGAGGTGARQRVHEREQALHAGSTADLMFTSGTTGRPKGVMAGHGPTIRAFSEWARVVGLDEGDRYLIVNPFFHTFGYKAGWVAAFLQGATVYPQQVFDADAVLARIEADRINFLPGPPTLFLTMLAHPRLKDSTSSSLRSAVTGAASVPPVLITRMREELGIRNVTTAYGLTECGGCATVCDPGPTAPKPSPAPAAGLPGTEVRCADTEGRSRAAG